MRNKKQFTKSVSIVVIFLFLGIAVTPSINISVAKASNDNDLVEVTSEACGIKGFENTTVKLTKQQYQDLQNDLVGFRARLNQTTTREEAVPIFKEAVVELNKYGLLPKGINVEQTQRLVVGQNQENIMKPQEKLILNHFLTLDNNSNYLCLVAGNTHRSYVISFLWPINVAVLFFLETVLFYLLDIVKNPVIQFGLLLTAAENTAWSEALA